MSKEVNEAVSSFLEDVLEGLKAQHKYLPSKYFYDEVGDGLFRQIMHMEEYYLTRKELEIFEREKQQILEVLGRDQPFRIIELGAGDGLKTKVLLRYFQEQKTDFTYTPVDISGNVLEILGDNLKSEIPNLRFDPYEGDYFDALSQISDSHEREVIFFLGSNVGNFPKEEAVSFLFGLRQFLKPNDLLFMGIDLKKDPSKILAAYNDKEGITTNFNLNLLDRINKELNGDFNRELFLHYPYYNPHTGECKSYLISKEDQSIRVGDEIIPISAWEAIFMEISKKYNETQILELAEDTGFKPVASFYDNEKWYADIVWEVKS
ncbi:MAG: L-histidine N(alpha)-methyltransferase [Ekhidna sp.]|nr:L-histidine N(alpha)-methyltransferase [Ekhidna sp.]